MSTMAVDFDLVVLGDVNPDLVIHGGDVVPAFGQAEHIVDEARLLMGGSGGILACGAAKLGLKVAVAAVVGDDLFGRFALEALVAAGVDVSAIVTDPERPTGLTVVLSLPDDRAMLTMPGTVADLTGALLPTDLLQRTRHVHISSFFLQRGLSPDLPDIFDQAHHAGATTSLDPNWDPEGEWDGGLHELLPQIDIFLPNAMEAMRLARISDLSEAIVRLRSSPLVVVKAGADGAIAAGAGELLKVPGIPRQIVDTTGAGDSFDAGFLAAFLAGEPLERCLKLGNACGTLSTRATGGTPGQATLAEALELAEQMEVSA
jgi:sugar/nucleoside kinase (ribokinase family)